MSAYYVDDAHIDALLTYLIDQRIQVPQLPDRSGPGDRFGVIVEPTPAHRLTDHVCGTINASELGRVLLAENNRSLRARYPDNNDMLGDAHLYRFRRFNREIGHAQALKGADCFDYQANETDDYHDTYAALVMRTLRDHAHRNFPGYDACDWHIRRV